MKIVTRCKSPFGRITIEEDSRGNRAYCQGGYFQSHADGNGVSLLIYVHALYGLLAQTDAESVLMIGCAGGSLATMLTRAGRRVTAVDVNPQAPDLARRYFGLPDSVDCAVADARAYLVATRRSFDAVVLDAFHGGRIAEDFHDEDFFARVAKRLKPGGAVFANVHVTSDRDRTADRIAAAMSGPFGTVRILDRPRGRYRNAVVMTGAVSRLKAPKLLMEPDSGAGRIRNALQRMRFRAPARRNRE
jgi:spermidine synthase